VVEEVAGGSLPAALGRFATFHPGVKLEVQIGVSAGLIEQLNDPYAGANRYTDPRETTKLADRIGEAIHKIIPASELGGITDNIGLSVSGINMAYNNSGTIGVEDADILISLQPNHAPTADYVKAMRGTAAASVPRYLLRLPAGRHGQPDPEFRRPRADRPAGGRQ